MQSKFRREGLPLTVVSTSGRLEKGVLKSPSMLACAAIFGGPLPFLLMTFLQNDSLMDIGQRADLYVVILRLVQSFGKPGLLLRQSSLLGFARCTIFQLAAQSRRHSKAFLWATSDFAGSERTEACV